MARAGDDPTAARTSRHHYHESGPVSARPVDGRVRRAVRHRGQMPPRLYSALEKNRGQSAPPPISDAFRGRPIFAGPKNRGQSAL
jgi:hypothetical protein